MVTGSRPLEAGPATGRSKEHAVRALAMVGGYVDAVGYVALFHLFTAHQSGNSAGLGAALAIGDWTAVWRRGTAIGAYVAGIVIGALIIELGRRRGLRSTGLAVNAAEIAALGVALGVGEAAARGGRLGPGVTVPYVAAAACLAGAMGLQTAALRRVGRRPVRTTFVTGVLTNMAETFVVACFRRDGEGRRRLLSLSALLASVWLVYLAGAVSGAAAQHAWSFAALAVPIAVVAAVTAWEFFARYDPDLPERGLGE